MGKLNSSSRKCVAQTSIFFSAQQAHSSVSSIKVITITGLIILGIVLDLGGT